MRYRQRGRNHKKEPSKHSETDEQMNEMKKKIYIYIWERICRSENRLSELKDRNFKTNQLEEKNKKEKKAYIIYGNPEKYAKY